ncbi:RNA polymerase sigma factor SigY [Cytobacillus kochii]|uniref:RNA polymerase sigma factor SigY n=1 Tax=Cytobacillus kochii TaxID=859143 RepID=UPI002783259D|nr:RNA polymerase sigma factor SigY [Cytobacillus kochii]MDQ0185633.1 RNA polymerase sigma-70 factor (ECF subfamily) [Cytobacillus kochii]
MEEKKWIKAAKKGDNQALAHLFKESYPLLVHYLMKLTLNREEAEDLAQETMTKAIEKLNQFQVKSKFSTWLISIGTKLYIDQKRRQKRADAFKAQHMRKLKWQAQSRNKDWDFLLASLGELEDELRVPIILKHYYGYAYDEIGKMLGIAEGTVKSRVHRGIKTIRKEMGEDEKGPGTMENPIKQG